MTPVRGRSRKSMPFDQFYAAMAAGASTKTSQVNADEFEAYGNEAWDKVKHLPAGYCHGDLYRNNIF